MFLSTKGNASNGKTCEISAIFNMNDSTWGAIKYTYKSKKYMLTLLTNKTSWQYNNCWTNEHCVHNNQYVYHCCSICLYIN